MANEATITASLSFQKGNVTAKSLTLPNKGSNVTGTHYNLRGQSIPTTAGGVILDVSGLATLGLYMIKNNDGANPVNILTAVSGTVIATINAGEAHFSRFPSGITAPAAIGIGSAVEIEYFVLEA